ncbi:unnamed protein product [Blepharisma stoltei]|uniref:non-specific serine/threonine protein kinase n=1 Tax=Blepharisma stoltei TaxID=1481888 RepID=A0AAU9KCT2_9CILI|nr:unnamed protein product [Blepharisma stoltei]
MGCVPSKNKKSSHVNKSYPQIRINPGMFILEKSDVFTAEYEVDHQLGHGAFSTVYQCIERKTGKVRAVKVVSKQALGKDHMTHTFKLKEIQVLKQLDHPNILKVFQIFEDKKSFYVIMEFCSGGELFNKIVKKRIFTEQEAAKIMYQLFSAVAYCHSKNIIHRDIKPENILLDERNEDYTIKVADFGSSTIFDNKTKISGCYGSVYYIAPEVLLNSYNEKCDEWSCGVILYILLSGRPPFNGKTDSEILRNIRTGNLNSEWRGFEYVSEEAKDLIVKLLDKNLLSRITAQEALEHSWVKKYKDLENLSQDHSNQTLSGVLQQLTHFNSNSKLKTAISTFISAQLVSQADTKELRNAFRLLDRNGDGRVSKEELLEKYKECVGGIDPSKQVDQIMKNVDTDHSGFIDYTEFIQATLRREILFSKKNLETAFRLFDKDGSGSISAKELRDILSNGELLDDAVWRDIIKEVDQNGDGEIDLREFQSLIMEKI